MKFDLEIAFDQHTYACDQTFEVVPDSGCPWDSHTHFWSEICPIMPNHLSILKTQILGALLVVTVSGLLNSSKNFHQDWTKSD